MLVISTTHHVAAQSQPSILSNKPAYRLTEQILDRIYNVDEESQSLIARLDKMLPRYPAIPLLRALSLRSAHYPIEPDSQEFEKMKGHLYEVIDQAEAVLDQEKDHAEANFFMLSAYGLLALYENEDGNSFKAVGQAKSAYSYLKKGFDLQEKYPDFYFSSGLYNYYRVKYPELHPVYKPFMWFFRDGDKALGLKQMHKAFRQSLFLRSESADYLMHIYLYYEDQPDKALSYGRKLVKEYPNNLYFAVGYTHAALAAGKLADTQTYAQRLMGSDQRYYRLVGHLFQGMLLEKKEQWDEAEAAYRRSLTFNVSIETEAAKNYRSYAYAGLARMAHHQKKHEQAKSLYEQALKTHSIRL